MVEIGKKEPLKKHPNGKMREKGARDKRKKTVVKKTRARLKACDPFSGKQYKMETKEEVNLEPDNSEMEDYVDNADDDINTYASFREKPKYRRDIIFAEELDTMKQQKEDKRVTTPSDQDQRQQGESLREYHRRMRKEKHQIQVEEIRKARKTSDKKKRYLEKKKLLKQQKMEAERAEREEREEEIKLHTVKGYAEQAERPPQLNEIIDKMIKSNKSFEREQQRLRKEKPKIDRKKALGLCRQNMSRFDSYVC